MGRRGGTRSVRLEHFDCTAFTGSFADLPLSSCGTISDRALQVIQRGGNVRAKRALPYGDDLPAASDQGSSADGIPGPIRFQLLRPEGLPVLRNSKVPTAVVRVPEAPVDEDHGVPLGQHQVWRPWKIAAVEPVPESRSEQA